MRIVLVGTDLAPVRAGAGAIETLLVGWASGLAGRGHDVHVVSRFPVPAAPAFESHVTATTDHLAHLVRRLKADVSVVNNRPLWQDAMAGRTVHLFHNYPDAWDALPGAARAAIAAGRAGDITIAAVSQALAAEAARVLELPPSAPVRVVAPFVDDAFFAVPTSPRAGAIVFPNRLLVKKGVLETLAVCPAFVDAGFSFCFLDYLSPWLEPTDEHRRLQDAIRSTKGCTLLPPLAGAAEMAQFYAGADAALCPSVRPEGLGLTALEAQACGVPVVTSGLGGLGEAQFRPDMVVDPGDAASFAAGITQAVSVPAAERALLRERVRGRFTTDASVARLAAVLEA